MADEQPTAEQSPSLEPVEPYYFFASFRHVLENLDKAAEIIPSDLKEKVRSYMNELMPQFEQLNKQASNQAQIDRLEEKIAALKAQDQPQ